MKQKLLYKYIKTLGFGNDSNQKIRTLNPDIDIFTYKIDFSSDEIDVPQNDAQIELPFIFYKNEKSLFEYHLIEWNKNELSFFIAVGEDKSHIIKAKEKPSEDNPFSKDVLIGDGFDYGTNTAGYENIIPDNIPFSKEKIDNSSFFDFVFEKQEKIKNEVDTHLLKNLIALKTELSKFDTNSENINALILKCLFVKYLEDRVILPLASFVDVLVSGSVEALQNTFKAISIINGDILKKEISITPQHIKQLEIFFTNDYLTFINEKRGSLFYPYKFDKIPIQLISNIYEEFLGKTNKQARQTNGIFYTRTFVVDFMLSHKIYPKLKAQANSTVLDPACGSGAFLVQAFRQILKNSKHDNLSIDEKANLLKKQIFGIDIDKDALQITAFSLYLTLLECVEKEEIKKQIEIKNPILPSLIGSNLLRKNAISDEIEFNIETQENRIAQNYSFTKFDCIVANPPWTELDNSKEKEVRKVIDNKIIYSNVDNYQISQAFLLKIDSFCKSSTDIAIIVNNSNFLNDGAKDFRKEILQKYRLVNFYELSNIASILFKNTVHPCAVLILDKKDINNHIVKYTTPRLTNFSKKLNVISYSSKDTKQAAQTDFIAEDMLWRIFVNGGWKDYQLIKKTIINNTGNYAIRCQRGIEALAESKMIQIKSPISIPIYNTTDKTNYFIFNVLENFKWNRKLRRLPLPKIFSKKYFEEEIINKITSSTDKEKITNCYSLKDQNFHSKNINNDETRLEVEDILAQVNQSLFSGQRIIIERAPSKRNKIKSIYTDERIISKDNTLIFKIENINSYIPLLAILNSSFTGYYLTHFSPQFSKGNRDALRTIDISEFPFPKIDSENKIAQEIQTKVMLLKKTKEQGFDISGIENELDELVFDLYGLLEFEKETIREFYQINVERKNDKAKITDFQIYADKFREVYQLVMKQDVKLNASYTISSNLGAIIKFDITNKTNFIQEVKRADSVSQQVLQLVKDKQIQRERFNGYIHEEKVKIYTNECFYIIKSNQFKDWTKHQAMEDANEEIHELLKKLNHGNA